MSKTLWEYSQEGNAEECRKCLENGEEINGRGGPYASTPLYESIPLAIGGQGMKWSDKQRYKDVVKLLLENDADIISGCMIGNRRTPLHAAAIYPHGSDFIDMLLEHQAQHLVDTLLSATDHDGMTPLHFACWRLGVPPLNISRLVDFGADASIQDQNGSTPLHLRPSWWAMNIMISESENRIDLQLRDVSGRTCLHTTTMPHLPSLDDREHKIKLLLANGADPSIRDNDGLTAEDIARNHVLTETTAGLTAEDIARNIELGAIAELIRVDKNTKRKMEAFAM